MDQSDSGVAFEVQLKGYAFLAPFPSHATADCLASCLWLGKCDCWRARLSDPSQEVDHRTAQRRVRCHREHDLSAWNPAEMALADFIARAIKGDKVKGDRSRRKGFASGAVFQGMVFGDLYREHDIRLGRVLVWYCPHHADLIMEYAHCVACDERGAPTRFDATRHPRGVVKRLLVKAPTGPYHEEQYWHCQSGDTYYESQLSSCPLCHRQRTRGAAQSTVWEIRPTRRVEMSAAFTVQTTEQSDPASRLLLEEILEQLHPLEREVVTLVQVQEWSQRQVAQQLALSPGQVNEILQTALHRLRALLTEET